MENALRATPEHVREQYERQLKTCRKPTARPCWNCAREKKLQFLLGKDET
nr:hypothetical protein [Luteimonas sp. FCS-9]